MTKTIKTFSKKTLAVFLSVMMIMTAWVFVAPEKAEAATTALTAFPSSATALDGRYKLTSNKTISANGTTASGWSVAANKTALIYIASDVTLTVNGGDASGTTGGKAGILMNSGSTLIITGPGKVVAKGGKGGNGAS